ncbi:hypothetical protein [Chryseobacterium sediminis]|uniref:Uncharacterized protein n=1 Tax=Chryseobacterium sediminis TaxID=1679494 RepID=A0A5B2U9R1_9FLAO|nr:hypothetical protein [Chryseobacterium sediminis]KAA2222995.1 hypothetical protein FW780_01985 [Chryseobacterium sediminis]
MSLGLNELVKGQIQFCLSQIKNPEERFQLLQEMMPGSSNEKEIFELTKKRIEASINKKERFKILPKRRVKK